MISRRRSLLILTMGGLCPSMILAQYRRGSSRGQGQKATGAGGSTPEEILLRFPGTLRSITKKQVLIEVEGEQELVFRRVKKTRFFDGEKESREEAVAPGTKVVIEGRRELNGDLDAVNVRWNEKPAADKEQPEKQ